MREGERRREMRFGVPDSKSINGEFEFEMGEATRPESLGRGREGKVTPTGNGGDPAYLEHALHPSMPST